MESFQHYSQRKGDVTYNFVHRICRACKNAQRNRRRKAERQRRRRVVTHDEGTVQQLIHELVVQEHGCAPWERLRWL